MKHHIWCNGVNALKAGEVTQAEIDACPWCGGNNGLIKNYPPELSEQEMVEIVIRKKSFLKICLEH